MADKKISELDPITGATVAADDVFVVVDTSGGVTRKITHDELKIALALGDTPQFNQINMADDAKILLGDSNDLQLYHESSTGNSYIADEGTGELRLEASNLIRMMGNNGETLAVFNEDGAVSLRYDGSAKFATTSTGIDVTNTSASAILRLERTGATNASDAELGQIEFYNSDGTSDGPNVTGKIVGSTHNSSGSGGNLRFFTHDGTEGGEGSDPVERVRIDGVGNVGIGGSPSKTLHVYGPDGAGEGTPTFNANTVAVFQNNGTSTDGTILNIVAGSAGNGFIGFGDSADDIRQAIVASMSDDSLELRTGNNSTALTIDSSGNLLVGTDSLAVSNSTGSVTGTVINTTGLFEAAKTGTVMELNRLTDDGKILNLRKDGSTVGNIGVDSGNLSIDTNNKTGLLFAGNVILPKNNGAISDNTVDLGRSSERYKDLYLSGGVYLGGTGAANKLDDYEEGNWYPRLKGESGGETANLATGNYTKVGNIVHLSVYVNTTVDTTGLSGILNISNLPFAAVAWAGGGSLTYATSLTTLDEIDTSLNLRPFSGSTFRVVKGSGVSFLNTSETNTGTITFMLEGWFRV